MSYDPLADVVDEPLEITAAVTAALKDFRASPKLQLLPGVDPEAERDRLSALVNRLLDRLLDGIAENPSKRWTLSQFQQALLELEDFDTEARENLGTELEHIMDILGIESSDGLLSFYLGGL